jgi:sarcosine oxidase
MPSALVVGAGIFGSALADRLIADGFRVTLIDAFEPGDPRSESGGETRMFRFSHGANRLYTELAYRTLNRWRELGTGVLVEAGAVWFARREDGWEADSERTLRELRIPVERLDHAELSRLYPSLQVDDLAYGLFEPLAGVLRAGEGVRALVARAVARGLEVRRGVARPDGSGVEVDGARLEADYVVWACGAWLPKLFPALVDLRVTRQDVVLFDVPGAWATPPVPGWLDFDSSFYGHGLIEPHGMKVSNDAEGAPVDPDSRPERADAAYVQRSRDYLAHRFPALAGAAVRSAPVCHYSITPDGGFVFAAHPEQPGVWLLGGGSGHGYKHGPAVAEHVSGVLRGEGKPEPRFGLGERAPSRALRTAGS